jgi:hypothetical protein
MSINIPVQNIFTTKLKTNIVKVKTARLLIADFLFENQQKAGILIIGNIIINYLR